LCSVQTRKPTLVAATQSGAACGFGFVIGSLENNVSQFQPSPNSQDVIKKLGGAQAHALTDAFLAAEIAVLGIIAAASGLSAATHLRSQEGTGHTEALLGTATTRTRWATSHFGAARAGVALLMLLGGLSIRIVAAMAPARPQSGRPRHGSVIGPDSRCMGHHQPGADCIRLGPRLTAHPRCCLSALAESAHWRP
jgi:hypothetical protein